MQLEQVELVLRQRWNPSEIANRERPAGQEVSLVRPGLETPRAAKEQTHFTCGDIRCGRAKPLARPAPTAAQHYHEHVDLVSADSRTVI